MGLRFIIFSAARFGSGPPGGTKNTCGQPFILCYFLFVIPLLI